MGMKFWEKMQENKHCLGVENGFTIPFIMGAYMGNQREFYRNKEQISSFVQRTLRDIYRDIYYSKKTIKIIECPECDNELIIQYVEKPNDRLYLEGHYSSISRLIYFDKKKHIFDIDSLTTYLLNRRSTKDNIKYGHLIQEGCFSYHKGDWKPFNEEELDFIKKMHEDIMQENMKHAKSIKLEFRGFDPAITENLIKNLKKL